MAGDTGPFWQGTPAMFAQHAKMKEDIAYIPIIRDDKAKAARGIKPFDLPLNKLASLIFRCWIIRCVL